MDIVRSVTNLPALRSRRRRLLAVFAHPDDEAYGCAGTLHRLARDPADAAVLLCLTRGEASAMGPARGLTPAEVGALRERRLERVAVVLDLAALLVEDLPDGRLARCAQSAVAGRIEAVLDALRPQVVITHDARGVNGHPDHIAAHWAVRRALEGRPGIRLAQIAYPPEVCEAVRPHLLFPTPRAEIDASVDLEAEELQAKEACLRAHEALATVLDEGDDGLTRRPPSEHYDLLGETHDPPLPDLFAALPGTL